MSNLSHLVKVSAPRIRVKSFNRFVVAAKKMGSGTPSGRPAGRLHPAFRLGRQGPRVAEPVRNAGKRGKPPESLADRIFRQGGGASPNPSGRKYDAVKDEYVKPGLRDLLESKGARKLLMYGTGAAGIAGGLKAGESLYSSLDQRVGKDRAFKRMIQDNPSLTNESPEHVKRVFNTLYNFNKDMAKDPLVAGSFTRRSLMFKDEGIQPMDVKTLSEIRKNMQGGKGGDSLARGVLGDTATLSGLARLAGG